MNDLSDLCRRLLRALIAAPIAWQTPPQLAALVGGPREAALDALAELDAAGWLDPWENEGELFVTLTTYAAERLGVRLIAGGRSETLRWAPLDAHEPCPRAPGRGQGDVDALDLIPDPSPGPEAEIEAAERAERLGPVRVADFEAPSLANLPRPAILIGSGLTPWPGPGQTLGPTCPACRSRPLPEKAYCLVCDRWGLDDFLAASRARTTAPGRPRRATPNTRPGTAESAAARAARKQKHKLRMAHKQAREKLPRPVRPAPASTTPRREVLPQS